MSGFLVFLIALPLSVYLLAGLLSVLDGGSRTRAVTRLTLRTALIGALVLLAPGPDRVWIGVAFVVVLALHGLKELMVRRAVLDPERQAPRVD